LSPWINPVASGVPRRGAHAFDFSIRCWSCEPFVNSRVTAQTGAARCQGCPRTCITVASQPWSPASREVSLPLVAHWKLPPEGVAEDDTRVNADSVNFIPAIGDHEHQAPAMPIPPRLPLWPRPHQVPLRPNSRRRKSNPLCRLQGYRSPTACRRTSPHPGCGRIHP